MTSSGEEIKNIPNLELSHKRFALTVSDDIVLPSEKETLKREILEIVTSANMVPFYQILVEQFKWKEDTQLVAKMQSTNDEKLKQLDAAIADAEENLGESEVREGFLARAEFYASIGDKTKAETAYSATIEKTVGMGQKLDIIFTLIRMGFFWNDNDLLSSNIEKAKSMIEQGGDWDRRNRLKVYEGLYLASIRDFKGSADLFLEALATFTATELCSYNQFVFYTVLVSMGAVDRVTLKKKVIDASEILTVIREIGDLSDFLNSLYDSNYSRFFVTLAGISEKMQRDKYLAPHEKYFCREMRIKAYSQLLDSYRSVKLDSMAEAYGISTDVLDRELSRFISSGRLHCKIDKVAGVVETTHPDSKNAQYQDTIKQGDLLLNRIGKLSRVINL
eukprot:TRINITY_DN10829_c0_g2_i1.p1 TRINITY_DN10829_c0_g2~~TRINITY_DN10829_c0_g2_i1.p1  ORF type:complete len:391 (+),score=82.04 TRINITY_DN10829_c0_g2_i1:273-1445(+)